MMELADKSYPVRFLIQDVLIRGGDPVRDLQALGRRVETFNTREPGWQDKILRIDAAWGPWNQTATGMRAGIFVSLEVAGFIRRSCPWLSRYLILDEGPLHVHRFSGQMPVGLLLNDSFINFSARDPALQGREG